jgi:hypothetical protein
MAIQDVFGVPELLESIISHLPERDILTKAQRVSRAWNAMIKSSPTIRKKIWMLPQLEAISPSHSRQDPEEGVLQQGCPVYLKADSMAWNTLIMSCGDSLGGKWSFTKVRPSLSMDRGPWYYALLDHRVQENDQRSKEVVESVRPSWYTMYISEPPITTALLTVEGKQRVPTLLYDKSGITMGMVYDVFMSIARLCPGMERELIASLVISCGTRRARTMRSQCGVINDDSTSRSSASGAARARAMATRKVETTRVETREVRLIATGLWMASTTWKDIEIRRVDDFA